MTSSILRGAIQGIVQQTETATRQITGATNTSSINSPAASNTEAQHFPFHGTNSRHTSSSSARHIAGHVRSRSDASSRHHSRQSSVVDIEFTHDSESQQQQTENNENNQSDNGMEFLSTITWVERALPFILLLLIRVLWDHRLGIIVFVGLFGTFFHVNSTIRKQIALKDRRQHRISLGVFLFLFCNIFAIYFVFNEQNLHHCLMFLKPSIHTMDVWAVFWCVGITDFVVRFVTMAIKCFIIITPRRMISFKKRGKQFLVIENISQFYRMLLPVPVWYNYFMLSYDVLGVDYFALFSTIGYFLLKVRMLFLKLKEILHAFINYCKDTRYGRAPSKEVLLELGDSCPICQEEMSDPVELTQCKHIFCEDCIGIWFDRERTCPMCRAKIAEDPQWRDGNTQSFIQFF